MSKTEDRIKAESKISQNGLEPPYEDPSTNQSTYKRLSFNIQSKDSILGKRTASDLDPNSKVKPSKRSKRVS